MSARLTAYMTARGQDGDLPRRRLSRDERFGLPDRVPDPLEETARERSKARTSPSCDAAAALLDGEWQEEAERSSRIAATTSMPIEKRQRAEVKQEEHAERPELQLGLPYNWSGILV